MKINFNNLRIQTAANYNALIRELNDCKMDEHYQAGYDTLLVDSVKIKKILDDLRSNIVGLACCYQPDDDDVKCVVDECGEFLVFREEE